MFTFWTFLTNTKCKLVTIFHKIKTIFPFPVVERYKYGLTCLHLRPRTMEWCAKFYINKDVKSYQVRKPFKHLAKQRKRDFIANCWEKLRVRVYKVLPGKVGNTNTGNNARKLFKNHEVFADICEAEHFLIEGLKVLLDAYNCSLPVGNATTFSFTWWH